MIYEQISSREVIRRVYDHYDILSSDWEPRAYEWIGEALNHMNIYDGFIPCHEDVEVKNHIGQLPCFIQGLKAIEYMKIRQIRVNSANKHDVEQADEFPNKGTYQLNSDGTFVSGYKDATMRVHYFKLASKFCEELNMEIPLVPNREKVLLAIEYYLLFRIIARGYKHPIYSLASHLNDNNPNKLWQKWFLKAKNSAKGLDRDAREIHRKLWTSLVLNPDATDISFHNR
jgi:hypothetical protein